MKNHIKEIAAGAVLVVLVLVGMLIYNSNQSNPIEDPCRGSADATCLNEYAKEELGLTKKTGITDSKVDNWSMEGCVYVERGRTSELVFEIMQGGRFTAEQARKYVDRMIYVYCPQEAK